MDWTIGQWFECDDDKVTFLNSGASYRTIDAYKLFYVEESSLQLSVRMQLDSESKLRSSFVESKSLE